MDIDCSQAMRRGSVVMYPKNKSWSKLLGPSGQGGGCCAITVDNRLWVSGLQVVMCKVATSFRKPIVATLGPVTKGTLWLNKKLSRPRQETCRFSICLTVTTVGVLSPEDMIRYVHPAPERVGNPSYMRPGGRNRGQQVGSIISLEEIRKAGKV